MGIRPSVFRALESEPARVLGPLGKRHGLQGLGFEYLSLRAYVVELVYAVRSERTDFGHEGSTPSVGTQGPVTQRQR